MLPVLQPVPATGRFDRRFLAGRSKRLSPDQPVKNIFHFLSPFFDHFRDKRQVGIVFFHEKQALLRVLVISTN